MDSFSDIETLDAAFAALGELLAERSLSFELCVIGGAAFLIQEPHRVHATSDVDIAARVVGDQRLATDDAVPPELVLRVASRRDLIRLKLVAAAQRRGAAGERHLDDLVRAGVTADELDDVAQWLHDSATPVDVVPVRLPVVIAALLERIDG